MLMLGSVTGNVADVREKSSPLTVFYGFLYKMGIYLIIIVMILYKQYTPVDMYVLSV